MWAPTLSVDSTCRRRMCVRAWIVPVGCFVGGILLYIITLRTHVSILRGIAFRHFRTSLNICFGSVLPRGFRVLVFLSSSARRALSYAMMAASCEGSPSAYIHLVVDLGLTQSTNPEGPEAPRVDQDKHAREHAFHRTTASCHATLCHTPPPSTHGHGPHPQVHACAMVRHVRDKDAGRAARK